MALVLPFIFRRPIHPLGNVSLVASQLRSSAWTPRSITATPLVSWYDISDRTTLYQSGTRGALGPAVTADGDPVGLVLDKSGNNNDLVQASSGARPLYRAAGYLDHDGSKWLTTSAGVQLTDGSGQHSTGVACYFTSNTGIQNPIDIDDFGGVRLSQLVRNNAGTSESIAFSSGVTPFTDSGPSITAATGVVLSEITSTSAVEVFVNGAGNGSTGVTPPMQTQPATLWVGASGSGSGGAQFLTGRFYGSASYQGALSTNDHAQLISYLTALLPTGGATLTASSGSFALSGSAATLTVARRLTASAASYVLTGSAANFAVGMPATAGAYTLTGSAASLLYKRVLPASAGSYALSGATAALQKGFTLSASAATFTVTGAAATLTIQRRLTASAASYALSGSPATLRVAINAATGSFTLTGSPASLLKGSRLTAASGSFALTGSLASLKYGRILTASAASFTLTGKAANFLLGRRLVAGSGSFALTGSAATLTKAGPGAFVLPAAAGAFALNGSAAGLLKGTRLTAGSASFVLSGFAAGGIAARRLTAAAGAFVLTGRDANLIQFSPSAKTYPLAGIVQPYPQTSAQTYPLEGEAQQYPLAS